MNNLQQMNREQFTKRLVNLCLRSGLTGMPKDETDQHILLKSVVLLVGSTQPFSEKEITEKLQDWLNRVCVIKNFDRVTLRRWLVDSGYLTRSSSGTVYQAAQPAPRPEMFAADVDEIDVIATIQAAREEMERRKQAFLSKSKTA